MDEYQARYEKHQARKKDILANVIGLENKPEISTDFLKIIETRKSQRIFNTEKITTEELAQIQKAILKAPSSCNRQAVKTVIAPDSDMKLVGGTGWLANADVVLLLFADMQAYKSPAEVDFMPYLDAGFIGMTVYYICEALGIGCCFVNPNIREENKEEFNRIYNKENHRFCGAMALGKYDKRAIL